MITKQKKPSAFMKPVRPSATLAKIVGSEPMPRTEITKKVWDFIKKNKLQDPNNKRMIKAGNTALRDIIGKDSIDMFDLTKQISKHLKPVEHAGCC